MVFERVTLAIAAAVFIAIGLLFLYDPAYTALVDIELPTGAARTDVRAVYGGLDLALGLFMLLAAARPSMTHAGLLLTALVFACLVGGRLLGFALDQPVPDINAKLLAAEGAGVIWSLAALAWHMRRARLDHPYPKA